MKKITQNFKKNKKIIFFNLFLLVFFIWLDQTIKNLMLSFLIQIPSNSFNVLPFFNLTLVLNTGVSFGLFANLLYGKTIISIIVILIIILFTYLFLKEEKWYLSLAFGIIIAGAIGNTIDRIKFGGVIDFLDFYIKNWHYPIFNTADCLIFIGGFILIFHDLFKKKI